MEKRGQVIGVLIILVIIAALVFAVIAWMQIRADKKNLPNESVANNETSEANAGEDINKDINESNNSVTKNETANSTIDDNIIPNPSVKITRTDLMDSSGGYFCDNNTNPTHGLRLYTYKIIDGVKNLSEEYLEADKLNVCDYYNNNTVIAGVTYNMDWRWTFVDGIDGYRAYQYYKWKNITREYNYYVDLKETSTRLYDTGLDLWIKE